MHDSLETKAEKECLAWMCPVYQGSGIFRYMIAEPSNLNFNLYLEISLRVTQILMSSRQSAGHKGFDGGFNTPGACRSVCCCDRHEMHEVHGR